jgi:hypothetical protein
VIEKIIQQSLVAGNEYIYGYADLRNQLVDKYTELPYGIVICRKLDDGIIDSIEKGPNLPYLNLYREVNLELSMVSQNIVKQLHSINYSALAIAPTLESEDHTPEYFKTLRLDFSHKMVATKAGLGWIGKTDLFISYKYGPRVRLVSILTNYPVNYSKKTVQESECGDCTLCLEQCPAKAASGELWNIQKDRDEFYNAFKCRDTCREFKIGDSPICGICVSVCPIGKLNA